MTARPMRSDAQERVLRRKGVGLAFGPPVDMASLNALPKPERRDALTKLVYDEVVDMYESLVDRLE